MPANDTLSRAESPTWLLHWGCKVHDRGDPYAGTRLLLHCGYWKRTGGVISTRSHFRKVSLPQCGKYLFPDTTVPFLKVTDDCWLYLRSLKMNYTLENKWHFWKASFWFLQFHNFHSYAPEISNLRKFIFIYSRYFCIILSIFLPIFYGLTTEIIYNFAMTSVWSFQHCWHLTYDYLISLLTNQCLSSLDTRPEAQFINKASIY